VSLLVAPLGLMNGPGNGVQLKKSTKCFMAIRVAAMAEDYSPSLEGCDSLGRLIGRQPGLLLEDYKILVFHVHVLSAMELQTNMAAFTAWVIL